MKIRIDSLNMFEKKVPIQDDQGHTDYVVMMFINVDYTDVSTGMEYTDHITVDDVEVYKSGENIMQWACNCINDRVNNASECAMAAQLKK